MKVDYHIHTEYSYDSKLKAEDLISKSISLNYESIAITEHLDLLPYELTRFGLPSFSQYTAKIRSLRAMHASTPLRVLCGVEVGDYQRVLPFASQFLAQLEFDLILGAVHFLSDHTNVAVPLQNPLTPAQILDYYRHNLALASNCDIQVLAHLGVYKRYYAQTPDESHCEGIFADIFQAMIERNIALEINFSGLRKPYGKMLPEPDQIYLYRSLGGTLFSLGSDAHQMQDFDALYPELPDWLVSGLIRLPRTT